MKKEDDEITCLIRRRMLQVWVHSYIYYELDKNIIDDRTWDKWANELAELIQKYPEKFRTIRHHELFEDWDGSTGYLLVKEATPALKRKAASLLAYHEEQRNKKRRKKSGKYKQK